VASVDHLLSYKCIQPFGAEVDFDLREQMMAGQRGHYVELLKQHDLLVFRGQQLDMARQIAVTEAFGPVEVTADTIGYISSEPRELPSLQEFAFHQDWAWARRTLNAIAFHAIEVVDGQTSTRFANAARAAGNLPPSTHARVAALKADMVGAINDELGLVAYKAGPAKYPLHETRSTIATDSLSGKQYIVVSAQQTASLVGVTRAQSDALLEEIFALMYSPGNIYEHFWRTGDLVIWNNRTLHHARSALNGMGKRILQRTCAGASLVSQYPEMGRYYREPRPPASPH
jgi:alpha-ketoglutarate-dependent taurine dioxygenase